MFLHRHPSRLPTFALVMLCQLVCVSVHAVMLDRLRLPAGFAMSIYASDVPNARQIAPGPPGIVFVGSRERGNVYAVIDHDGDHTADETRLLLSGLNMPSGVAYRNGTLFVAEIHRVLALDDINQHLDQPPRPRVVYTDLPDDTHHGWKFIAFGPDGKLYIPVGAPCNVCEVDVPHGTIMRVDLNSKQREIVAYGVRNSVGFAWHPLNHKFWFTDNGRDWMGDDKPGCELNRVDEIGRHYGFPYVHAAGTADDRFKDKSVAKRAVAPARVLGAHVAPLGLLFYTGTQFPAKYKHSLLVAEHGSWNRKRKSGYRVMIAELDGSDNVVAYREFISGWLTGQAHWGRPVDFAQLADGSVLISDDYAGVLYRLSYAP